MADALLPKGTFRETVWRTMSMAASPPTRNTTARRSIITATKLKSVPIAMSRRAVVLSQAWQL